MTFVRCDLPNAYICELESELKKKDMLIELITGLVRGKCPRIDEIINQYQHQLNHIEDQHKYQYQHQLNHTEDQHKCKRVDELTERIQVLETENNDLQSILKEYEQQLKECQTKNDELDNEVTICRQTLNLRDEELITTKKEKEELLMRTGEQENEATDFKQRLILKNEDLITMKKENEKLLTRTIELEKEGIKQRLNLKDEELITIQKEKEELLKRNDVLETEVVVFKQRLNLRDEDLIAIEKEKEVLLARTDELEKEVTIFNKTLNFKEEEIIAINQQKEELLTRLSQYTSAQLVHDNPNVADLSDLNRPTKLAEKLSELYDNEWTDGFEVLTENYKFTETDAIEQLLDILMDAYKYCTKISNKQDKMIKKALLSPVAGDVGEDQHTELNSIQLRSIVDLRKQTSNWSLTAVQKGLLDTIKISGQNSPNVTQFIKYIDQCAALCWHMVIRSPPLVFEVSVSEGSEFDKTKYRFYQTSGMNLNFIVWPVLRLHEDGPLLSKGIAEAM